MTLPHDTIETRKLLAAATPGPWENILREEKRDRMAWCDLVDNRGNVVLDTLNSGVAEIHAEEYRLWDEQGRMNLDLIARLRNSASAICDRLEYLEAIVNRLPMTADGVPITFGQKVYPPCGGPAIDASFRGGKAVYCFHGSCRDEGCQGDSSSGTHHEVEKCYSTREAAEAARKYRK